MRLPVVPAVYLICLKKIYGSSGRYDTCLMVPMPVIWYSRVEQLCIIVTSLNIDFLKT